MSQNKAKATILVKVKDKLEVELTREEARQLMETLEAALGSIRMTELEATLRKVLQERVLDNATPFTVIPPVIYDPPPQVRRRFRLSMTRHLGPGIRRAQAL